MAGERPELPITVEDLEARAREVMSPEVYDYVAGGAGAEWTVRANREAFDAWRIVPRMLVDVSERELRTELLGTELPAPVLLAPVGVLSIVHPEAELAVARAAAGLGLPMVLSNAASSTVEDVAGALGDSPRWFQLYWPADRELAASFVERAEAAGYGAVVVTLDTRILAWRPRDVAAAYLPFLRGEGVAIYFSDPVFRDRLEASPEDDPQAAIGAWALQFPNPALTWDDLRFLREHTGLPVLLKGILHPDDARKAVEHGMDGIVVSNHGGRQVDGAIGSLDALPTVVDAVAGDIPILFDGGIRSGSDALKAIALGARAVLIGRPYAYALGIGGSEALTDFLRGFLAELEITIGLCGLQRPSEATPELLTA